MRLNHPAAVVADGAARINVSAGGGWGMYSQCERGGVCGRGETPFLAMGTVTCSEEMERMAVFAMRYTKANVVECGGDADYYLFRVLGELQAGAANRRRSGCGFIGDKA